MILISIFIISAFYFLAMRHTLFLMSVETLCNFYSTQDECLYFWNTFVLLNDASCDTSNIQSYNRGFRKTFNSNICNCIGCLLHTMTDSDHIIR